MSNTGPQIQDNNGNITQQEREEAAATYDVRDMFKLDVKFTDTEIRESCKIYNTHWDDRFNAANALSMELILNNCHPDMLRKITIQLEAVPEDERGGALALHFIRRAVIRASQENSETVKTALKSFKIKDIAAQNVDDTIRILRNAHSTLRIVTYGVRDVVVQSEILCHFQSSRWH